MKIDGSGQPAISDRPLSDALVGLPAPARDIHRASEYALHLSGTDIGLLGVLLKGPLGNRHRHPSQTTVPQPVSSHP